MIKINLATRKQTPLEADSARGTFGGGLTKFNVRLDGAKSASIRRLAIAAAAAVMATYFLEGYQEEETRKYSELLPTITAEKQKLTAELNKTKDFEPKKKALDLDEATIKLKIETIKKLIVDRQTPPKMLLALATSIPGEVWLSDLKIDPEGLKLKGNSLGFNQISDFMKGLNESAYFSELKLVSTVQAKDDTGQEVAAFEMSAKRRAQ